DGAQALQRLVEPGDQQALALQEVLPRRRAGAARYAVLLEAQRMGVVAQRDMAADDIFGRHGRETNWKIGNRKQESGARPRGLAHGLSGSSGLKNNKG